MRKIILGVTISGLLTFNPWWTSNIHSGDKPRQTIKSQRNIEVRKENIASPRNTGKVPQKVASRSSTPRVLTMTATAYHETGPVKLKGWYAGPGRVSVDPRVIPLGTKLYIEGYGPAIAVDTGSKVKGLHVDIWLPTHKQCVDWGNPKVKVWVYK